MKTNMVQKIKSCALNLCLLKRENQQKEAQQDKTYNSKDMGRILTEMLYSVTT